MSAARWPLWGSYAFLAVDTPGAMGEARSLADRMLDEVGTACSRFRDDSELVRVNRRPGSWVECGPVLVAAVRAALAAAEATDGLVDPCLGRSLVSLGYDRDFDELRTLPGLHFGTSETAVRPGAWREVLVADDAVRVPSDVTLDLGATAKAWAADRLAEVISQRLDCTAVVSLGGDLRVAGRGAPSWPVTITERPDPSPADPRATVRVSGGLATSTTVVRRWGGRGTPERHHLLDPRTGLPADGTFRTVSAAGATCLAANAATVAAVVLGAGAPDWLVSRGVAARLVHRSGAVRTVGDWPASTENEEECA